MPAKKVLYVCPQSQLGGAEQVTRLLCKLHDPQRWRPSVFLTSSGPLAEDMRSSGLEVRVSRHQRPRLRSPYSILRTAGEIAALARAEGIDLIHGVMSYGHLLGGPAALLCRRPAVWFQHGPVGPIDWLAARIPAREIFVNSSYTLGMETRFHPSAGRLTIIHPGCEAVGATAASNARLELRKRFNWAESDLVFGLIGRISSLKGHKLFIQAAADAGRDFPNAKFLIAGESFMPGDDSYLREVTDFANRRGLGDRIGFAGFISPERGSGIPACDVLVNASISPEGFGLTIIEGMMAGLPVIAPHTGGPMEIFTEEREGLFFESGDASGLAKAISTLAGSRDLRTRLGAAGTVRAKAEYSARAMTDRVEARYDALFLS